MTPEAGASPSRSIWKSRVAIADEIELKMPRGSELLSVADQEGLGRTLDFWFLALPQEGEETRTIRVFGTGHAIEAGVLTNFQYLATVLTVGSALVWHVFLKGDRKAPPRDVRE